MFHVMLVLPVLAAIGAILFLPYCVVGILQLLLTIFCRRPIFLMIPFLLGGAGVVWSVLYFRDSLPIASYLWYWGIYFGIALLILFVVRAIKKAVVSELDKRLPVQGQGKEEH